MVTRVALRFVHDTSYHRMPLDQSPVAIGQLVVAVVTVLSIRTKAAAKSSFVQANICLFSLTVVLTNCLSVFLLDCAFCSQPGFPQMTSSLSSA